jgi:hypothetical protein
MHFMRRFERTISQGFDRCLLKALTRMLPIRGAARRP